MELLLERNRKFHEVQRKLREQGHLAKGAVTLSEQIDVVIKQLGSERALLAHTPKLISFKVRWSTFWLSKDGLKGETGFSM